MFQFLRIQRLINLLTQSPEQLFDASIEKDSNDRETDETIEDDEQLKKDNIRTEK